MVSTLSQIAPPAASRPLLQHIQAGGRRHYRENENMSIYCSVAALGSTTIFSRLQLCECDADSELGSPTTTWLYRYVCSELTGRTEELLLRHVRAFVPSADSCRIAFCWSFPLDAAVGGSLTTLAPPPFLLAVRETTHTACKGGGRQQACKRVSSLTRGFKF